MKNYSQMDSQNLPSIARKVAWLSAPESWSVDISEVEVHETQMSWVFLVGDLAYKLKKPVCTTLMDFRTIENRKKNCQTEVILNRRLAPGVYLGYAALTYEADGQLVLNGDGTAVDWLVVMRRLDAELMLNRMIQADLVHGEHVDALAALFSSFYAGLNPVDLSQERRTEIFQLQINLDREMFSNSQFDLPQGVVADMCNTIEQVIVSPPKWLTVRVAERRIVEGHGDLRLEHIFLSEPPVVIDCLEFNRTLRLVDPFEELAALRMECERLGSRWIGDAIIEKTSTILNDQPDSRLLAFYATLKASIRTRLALQHLTQPEIRAKGRWLPLAHSYFALAERSAHELVNPIN